jgi:phospholipid/cholesterol/gamma-HCH transport system substrate-binding protein
MPRKPPEQPGVKDFNEGVYHRPPRGLSFVKTGIIALILILILSYLAFAKSVPWAAPEYEVTATFDNAATLRSTSPVRIAGVNVGEVTSVEVSGDDAKVTMSISEEGLPLHADATATIRPRLFLEGNFFVDLRPGSPSGAELADGGDIPIGQTATAVQLDEILTTLQQPDRENLSDLLDGYGSALADEPTPEQDVGQDPDVQGESAAQAINDSFDYGGDAGKSTAQVSEAFLGESPGDLSGLISSSGRVFEKLGAEETQLRNLITNFSVAAGAFAEESQNLELTLSELAPTLEQAEPALVELDKTFPPLRAFARELTPGVKELPATIEAGTPWLRQTRLLLADEELGGIASQLAAATPTLAKGTVSLTGFTTELGLTSRCVSRVLVPTGDIVINDPFSTGASNYQEFFYSLAAQSGEGGNFDGNGQFLRVNTGGGPVQVSTPVPGAAGSSASLFGNAIMEPTGSQPLPPDSKPPIRTDVDCYRNAVADLNGPAAAVGAPSPAAVTP